MLHIISTPIGNLEDMTLRGVRLLTDLTDVICEDTRSTKKLLQLLDIEYSQKKFYSLTSFTKSHQIDFYKDLLSTKDVGLVSDAGTPGLSDPGKLLVKLCNDNNLPYTVLPGANALVPAVVAAGFDTSDFRFVGFLPKKKGKQTLVKQIIGSPFPTFFYESVHRVEKTLQYFIDFGAEGHVSLARELSKKHEQYITGTITEMLEKIQAGEIVVKGEFVLGYYPSK